MLASISMNNSISWYSLDNNLAIVERGAVPKDGAFRIIDDYFAGLKSHYESGEEAIASTVFGFQKNQSEFIEIGVDSVTDIAFKYEVSIPRKIVFFNMPRIIQKERRLRSKEDLKAMVSAFYDLDSDSYLAHASV